MQREVLRLRRGLLAALVAAIAALCAMAGPAFGAPYESVPTPTIEGPIPVTETSHPFAATDIPLANYGYTEEEFFVSGTGYTYSTTGAVNVNGSKITTGGPNSNGTYPFKTRIIVRRPIDPSKFNGKVVAEWENVTAGYDLEANWYGDPYYLLKHGYAFVGIDAQNVGVSALKKFNSTRYGSLEVGPTGDALSYDIYAAALKAIRGDGTGPLPLGEEETSKITKLTASGESQSCSRLVTYFNKVAPLQEIADNYLLTVCTGAIRADRPEKVLRIITEFENKAEQTEAEYPSNPSLRHWEAAGASHVPFDAASNWAPPIERDLGPQIASCVKKPLSKIQWPFMVNVGTKDLEEWSEGGSPPPLAPRGQYVNSKTLAKNSLGEALGGIRYPEIEVPIGIQTSENSAAPPPNPYPDSAFCQLLGGNVPFSEETLNGLYTNYGEYVDKVKADTEKLEGEGFILPEDGARVIESAEEYPRLRPTQPVTGDPTPNTGSFSLSWRGPVPSHLVSQVPRFVETHPQFEVQHRNGEGEWSTIASGLSSAQYAASEAQSGHWSYRVRSKTIVPAFAIEPEEELVSPWSEPSATITVDKTPPTIEMSCPATAAVGQSGVVATVTASDESGLKTDPSGTIPIDTSSGGTKTVSATAVDNLGNEATSSCSTQVGFSQVITGNVKGKLLVKAGQSVELTSTAKVSGNVTVKPGGALDVEGATLSGTVSAKGAALVRICGADIAGSVKAVASTGSVVIGDGGECSANDLHGALTVKSNTAGVKLVGNQMHSSAKVTGNDGGTAVTGNTVAGSLTVTGNSGSVTDTPNEVEGKSKIQ
ncbi:MAG TPA: alpha/beta hydrolase domain-containing protein [Solirubrobacteraceae bacterium]|nr:alpha/beta hydrolase domain-containing protein [Solirubrobacteraceae bacterium]